MTTELSEASVFELHMEDSGLNYFYDSASTQVFCLFFYLKKFFIRPHHEVNIQRVNKITSKSLPKLRNVNVNIATFEGALLLLPLFSIYTLNFLNHNMIYTINSAILCLT